MKSLSQKEGRNTRYFEIQEDGVLVRTNIAKAFNEYKIHFTDIYDDESVFRKTKDFVLIGIAVSVVLNSIMLTIIINESYQLSQSAGMIVFVIAMMPAFVITALCNNEFKIENAKNIAASKPLLFSYRKKEMEEVDAFIAEIKKGKKEYYLREYYKVDKLIPTQTQIARIHWLYENKYITESDAEFIIEELETQRIIRGQ
ncbi:hypothetical protein [Chryseobacterium phocaeense]|uniref:hypothetical protein n=1 Tax=Chryseobacterium phocaeense TaxID=1816690 RepID=UPI0009BA4996|nr:hypothetical protein [Chryseobacterium phocaeense]